MNIFFLDRNSVVAAEYQCDKHVIKMILESAQLLSSVHHMTHSNIAGQLYRLTHKNHPCAIWCRSSLDNYKWLLSHAKALLSEYTYRYNKTHASTKIINLCENLPHITGELTNPPLAMPDEFKTNDFVEAYRNYYKYKQTIIQMRWTNRKKPEWL